MSKQINIFKGLNEAACDELMIAKKDEHIKHEKMAYLFISLIIGVLAISALV